jgi:hypothetical protein
MAIAAASLFTVFSYACNDVGGDGLTVGGDCSSDLDCNYMCVRGNDYPGGMCTLACASSSDCPSKTTCIDDEGGICAPECDGDGDCADYGSGWKCGEMDVLGVSGTARVCRGGQSSSSSTSSTGGQGGNGEGGSGGGGSSEGGSGEAGAGGR